MGGCLGLEGAQAAVGGGIWTAAGGLQESVALFCPSVAVAALGTPLHPISGLSCTWQPRPSHSPSVSFLLRSGWLRSALPRRSIWGMSAWVYCLLNSKRIKGRHISAAFYVMMNKTFPHQHLNKQLLFFPYVLRKILQFSVRLLLSGHLSEDLDFTCRELDDGYSKNYELFF